MSHDFTAPGTPLDDYRDPDLEALGEGEEPSDLDALRSELNAKVAPTVTIPVTGRAGWAARFRTDFTGADIDALRKVAKNRRMVDGVDGIKFSALLLAKTCQGITRNGVELSEALGTAQAVTFVSAELRELLTDPQTGIGPVNADETVRKFYGLEGHVDATARRLMVEAGWGDEVDAEGPTE